MINEKEVAIVNASSRALKIIKKASDMPVEEIIQRLMPFLSDMNEEAKIAAIAAINGIVKMRRDKTYNNLTDRKLIEKFVTKFKEESSEELD